MRRLVIRSKTGPVLRLWRKFRTLSSNLHSLRLHQCEYARPNYSHEENQVAISPWFKPHIVLLCTTKLALSNPSMQAQAFWSSLRVWSAEKRLISRRILHDVKPPSSFSERRTQEGNFLAYYDLKIWAWYTHWGFEPQESKHVILSFLSIIRSSWFTAHIRRPHCTQHRGVQHV